MMYLKKTHSYNMSHFVSATIGCKGIKSDVRRAVHRNIFL